MTLFIVEYTTGEYSDKQVFTSGIFDSMEAADIYAAKIRNYYAEEKNDEFYEFNECYVFPVELNEENAKFNFK